MLFSNPGHDSPPDDIRPHGSQYDLPELTRNNYLMGYLNENRSSYRVSYYDINIDFNIEQKSIKGFVIIKAESINDLNKLQIDLAENLNITRISHKNQELSFSRELDAVLIKVVFLKLKLTMVEYLKELITLHGQVDLLGLRIKMDVTGLLYHVREKVHEFGGLIKII